MPAKSLFQKLLSLILTFFILNGTMFFVIAETPLETPDADEEPPLPYLGLNEFLSELDITFSEYLEIVAGFERSGIYPHYLDKNASRYAAYQSLNPELSESTAIAFVNVDADTEPYSYYVEVPEPDFIGILVNKHHKLPQDREPDDLIHLTSGYRMREEAARAFQTMRDEMESLNFNIIIVSAYRTYRQQQSLHSSGGATADEDTARAGHSEHQTGLAVDFLHRLRGGQLSRANFQDSDEYAWLLENAHNYGFILRYPDTYREYHQYIFEPWHWRYVGVDIATTMYNEKIPIYEEFYGKYLTSDVLTRARERILNQRQLTEEEAALEAAVLAAEQEAMRRAAQEAHKAQMLEASKHESIISREVLYIILGVVTLILVITLPILFMKYLKYSRIY